MLVCIYPIKKNLFRFSCSKCTFSMHINVSMHLFFQVNRTRWLKFEEEPWITSQIIVRNVKNNSFIFLSFLLFPFRHLFRLFFFVLNIKIISNILLFYCNWILKFIFILLRKYLGCKHALERDSGFYKNYDNFYGNNWFMDGINFVRCFSQGRKLNELGKYIFRITSSTP